MFFGMGATSSVIQAARRADWRRERVAESAGGAGEHEGAHATLRRGFEQVQRPGDIGVDEGLARMRGHVRLV